MLKSLALVSLLAGCVDVTDEEGVTESAITAVAGATYQIVNQGGECIDVPSFSRASGTRLQTHLCKRSGYGANQHVAFEAVPGGYRLRNVDSQLCFDLPSSATADGTYVQQSQCHTGTNQIWNTQDEPFGYVRLTSALDATRCIHVGAAHQLQLSRCAILSTSAKSFALAPVRTHYSLRIGAQCLDMPGHTTATGATPQLFGCKTDGTTNQEWNFEPVASGVFRLRQTHAGKCLDLRGGSLADTTVIEQNPCTNATNQQWRFVQQTASQWKLQNVASNKCADFFNGNLRQYTCSPSWTTQLFTFEPGLSGPPLGMSSSAAFLPPASGPSPLFAVDNRLVPVVLDVTVLDNAATLTWSDANAITRDYRVFVTETIAGIPGGTREEIPVPRADRAFWFGRIQGRPLVPGRHYDVEVWALSAAGAQPSALASRKAFDLPRANVTIGTQLNGAVSHPTPIGVFSVFDFNNNGIVDGAPAGPGTFPRFPSVSPANTPLAAVGNRYATAGNLRANAIVGYLLQEGNRQSFVAFHLFIDPATNAAQSIAVFYGDLGGIPGGNVWSSPAQVVGSLTVTNAASPFLPNIINGHVTAPAMANDGSMRVIDFDFVTALDPG